MAVYRVNKSRNYTVMSNFHLRDKNLSLKAVGLLSKMLSFNDGWKFSTRGLSAICKEGPDAILSALRELERHGYLVRHRQRDSKGRLSSTIFDIFEEPQPALPDTGSPHMENPDVDNPDMEKPHEGNPAQINTNQVITQERNNSLSNYQSINLDGMDGIDERARYEELIRDNLELEILSRDHRFDTDRVNEMVEIMLDAICSTRPTIRINGEDMPQQVVKSRFLKLNSSHIEYVLHAMDECPSDIRNIRAYMLTTLYNASLTIARVIVPKDVKRGKVFGDVFEINYREQAANVARNSVEPDHDRLTFADGYVLDAPCRSSFDEAMALVGEHGGVVTHQTLPKDADALTEVLSTQKSRRDKLPEAETKEVLAPLPVAELRKYEAIKQAHPDALVCFAQNGYFELYGKDAEKAAPLLGTKLLEKKVRGKPPMPVTGFRETAWVAGSHKLLKSGTDVFLSKDGETFKELKAADYIPVGATLNVDGIRCRIDAVDFAADEVRLTNIADKNRPIRFSESIQYVRSYVEDAGTAIYDTIPKKPAARESIRDKLKSAQKAQSPHIPKPQKTKGKDMVL